LTTRFQVLTALNQAVYGGNFGTEIKLPECEFFRRRLSISMSADRKTIACANFDGTVRLFDSRTGKKLNVFKGSANWVNDVHFSPDGKTIASGTVEGDVKLWDRATKKILVQMVKSLLPGTLIARLHFGIFRRVKNSKP
jgi:WD40 repeat protein